MNEAAEQLDVNCPVRMDARYQHRNRAFRRRSSGARSAAADSPAASRTRRTLWRLRPRFGLPGTKLIPIRHFGPVRNDPGALHDYRDLLRL